MRLVSIRTAAQESQISSRTIGNMLADGRLTKYKLTGGTLVRIDMDELYSLFEAQH